MTLENLYLIAQIVAALAVVSSLIFVGFQIRGNTREQHQRRRMEVLTIRNEALEFFAADRDMADFVLRGYRDLESLDGPERIRFTNMHTRIIHAMETVRQMCETGDLEWDVLERLERISYPAVGSPGLKDWWERPSIKEWFSVETQAQIDRIMREGPGKGLSPMPDWRNAGPKDAGGGGNDA